jgi:hypothetical protein
MKVLSNIVLNVSMTMDSTKTTHQRQECIGTVYGVNFLSRQQLKKAPIISGQEKIENTHIKEGVYKKITEEILNGLQLDFHAVSATFFCWVRLFGVHCENILK